MKKGNLIINESFWNLSKNKNLRSQTYLIPELSVLDKDTSSIAEYTRNLGLLLQTNDSNASSLYGIEIKTNGSSRSGRIPLVRHTKTSQSIWKVVFKLRDVDKAITDLDTLVYYLKNSRPDEKLELPKKILVTSFDESEYLEETHLSEYVKKHVSENNIIWISSEFITDLLKKSGKIDVDSITSKTKAIYTKRPFL